jgi:hypothetical protein
VVEGDEVAVCPVEVLDAQFHLVKCLAFGLGQYIIIDHE